MTFTKSWHRCSRGLVVESDFRLAWGPKQMNKSIQGEDTQEYRHYIDKCLIFKLIQSLQYYGPPCTLTVTLIYTTLALI